MIIAWQTLIYFRENLFTTLNSILRPCYNSLTFQNKIKATDEETDEDDVFADFDAEKGVVFFPPVYLQRYAAITDCLLDKRWCSKLEKVVDLGYHDLSFIKYLKDIPGINVIYGVDIEDLSSELIDTQEPSKFNGNPVHVTLFQGNAADPDYHLIGCDAVIAIEMIEHMLPHDLERLVHTVFGFAKPWVAIFTTPNAEFNTLFKNLESNGLRRLDHLFEWTRVQFNDWCSNIVERYPLYTVTCSGIGPGPPGTQNLGCCSQMAVFVNKDYHKQKDLDPNSMAMVASKDEDLCTSLIADSIGCDSVLNHKFDSSLSPSILNCSSFYVKRFSKMTHNLIARYSQDGSFLTKDVISEVRHLSNILNLNKDTQLAVVSPFIWKNINWGDNAPYWNQYYKVIKEYNQQKSICDDDRILDLLSSEICRLVDRQQEQTETDDDVVFWMDINQFEIPISYLMNVVCHITKDEDRVKDILQWNGYYIEKNMLIYIKPVLDECHLLNYKVDDAQDFSSNVKFPS